MDVEKRKNVVGKHRGNATVDGLPRRRDVTTITQRHVSGTPRPQLATSSSKERSLSDQQSEEKTNEKKSSSVKTVEIKIILPAIFSLSKVAEITKKPVKPTYHRVKRFIGNTSKNRRIVGVLSLAIVICSGLGYVHFTKQNPKIVIDTKATNTVPELQTGTPDYPTVLPASKSIDELGGWRRLSPADKDPVYVYADSIGTTSISVSQQPLPKEFKSDTEEKIKQVAASFNANEKIIVGSTTVYIGKSSDGPQSVLFYKGDLLILMKSRGEIQNALWADYVKQLQ